MSPHYTPHLSISFASFCNIAQTGGGGQGQGGLLCHGVVRCCCCSSSCYSAVWFYQYCFDSIVYFCLYCVFIIVVGPSEVFCNFGAAVMLDGGVIKNGDEWSLAENVSWLGGAKKMFIRECYKRDADELLGEHDLALKIALILGPKGIGKTMFLNYLIVRIVEKVRSRNGLESSSITYVHKPIDTPECVRFTSQGCVFDKSKADYFLSDSVDIADGTLGESLLLEVASENQTNYKIFLDRITEKNGRRITMGVWTLDELRHVTPEAWNDGEVDFLYKVFGGRVRNVLGGDLIATDVDYVIESTALWFFGNTAKETYPASWNRALQLIRNTIADAREKTTKDELAIQTSLFWVVNSGAGTSEFSSTFLKLVAGQMKDNMEVNLWTLPKS